MCVEHQSQLDFQVHSDMKLTMTLKELLSGSSAKAQLTAMFAKALLQHYSSKDEIEIIVAYGDKVAYPTYETSHGHEEADTLIVHQVMTVGPNSAIDVWSPDTDVFILLLDLVAHGRLSSGSRLQFVTGRGIKHRKIDVVEKAHAYGLQKCKGLIGLHNFSGADWGGKFVGISKKSWIKAYYKLQDHDPALTFFLNLGEQLIRGNLEQGALPAAAQLIEKFVCQMYSTNGPSTLPALRWNLFQTKNLEGEMLPPTRAALLPHILRANFTSMVSKSYTTAMPQLPKIEDCGWESVGQEYFPMKCLELPAPMAVLELRKCSCKDCSVRRCSCYKNGLPCTPLCKCYSNDCNNKVKIAGASENDDVVEP